jgi:hypothetical protein
VTSPLDLDPHQLADMLFSQPGAAARVSAICDQFAGALDLARIAG